MKKIIIILFICSYSSSHAQSLFFENGILFMKSFVEVSMPYSEPNHTAQEKYFTFGYEQRTNWKKKPSLSIAYNFARSSIGLTLYDNPYTSFSGIGGSIIIIHGLTTGINYPFKANKFLTFRLGGAVQVLYAKRTNPFRSVLSVNELPYVGTAEKLPFPGVKVQPEVNGKMDFKFLKRVHFYLGLAYTLGFSRHHELHFVHSFDGVPQTTAINYTNGTSWRMEIGLKYDLKLIHDSYK